MAFVGIVIAGIVVLSVLATAPPPLASVRVSDLSAPSYAAQKVRVNGAKVYVRELPVPDFMRSLTNLPPEYKYTFSVVDAEGRGTIVLQGFSTSLFGLSLDQRVEITGVVNYFYSPATRTFLPYILVESLK